MYSTQTDILEQISLNELIGLTDDSAQGIVDASAVGRAIADADVEIDSYAASRYPVPFAPVSPMIRKLSVDIAIYNLQARRQGATEDRIKRYQNAVAFLRSLARGEVTLGANAPAECSSDGIEASTTEEERIFTRDTMRGY